MIAATILIVEDELVVGLELEERLRREGYAVAAVVRTAAEALRVVETRHVDLALLDVRLAGGDDGVELAEQLAAFDIPCVFLTAHGDPATLRRIKAIDAQGYLLKPFDGRLLHLTIDTALHRHASEQARRAAEQARRSSEAVQAAILAHAPDAVLVVADDGAIVLTNPAAAQMFEPDAPALADDRTLAELLPELGSAQLRAAIGSPLRTTARRVGGPSFPVGLAAAAIALDQGEHLVLFIRDLSRQLELERELVESRQLELAGRLAAAIAHDLNSLLSVVAMIAYQLPAHEGLDQDLHQAVELGTALTARLLALARHGRESIPATPTDVDQVLHTVERLVRRSVNTMVSVEFELEPDSGTILIGPGQLEQLVLNLALNANRAMPEGGELRVRSWIEPDEDSAGWVWLEIADTGVGMDEELQRRAFEPFFTTRRDAGGSGLGLAIVKDVIEDAGGTIELDSRPGEGCRFRIRLPRHDDAPQRAPVSPAITSRRGRGHQILLVDDDELHRRTMARLLRSSGFGVVEQPGAGNALLFAQRSKDELDLAIVDLDLPYMDGYELETRLREARPGLPVLLLSSTVVAAPRILHRPIDAERLLHAVAELLNHQLLNHQETH